MPTVSAANLTRLRYTKHATLLRLAVYAPAAIWTAQVDGAQTTGDTTITVKNVVQVRAPAEHFQVIIGSTAGGREYGEARWKSYAAPTLTISAHNCELPDNAYITVLEEIKPQAIYATMDATDVVYEDGAKAYTDENFRYHPIARIGPPAVAYRDETTGIATVNFYGDCSAFGAALLSHAWDFKDGNPAASAIEGTAIAPIAVEFATAGARYISHTVTDTSVKTHTAYRPVFIFDRHSGTLPYTQIEVDGMEGDVEAGGWSCNVTVHTAAGSDAFPPQALCVIFAEDWFGSEEVSIGGAWTYRENIVMVGYIRRGTVRKDWAHNVVEFTVEGIGCLLNNIPGNALSLESTAVPTGWHQLSSLNPVHAAYHLLTEHSTVDHICDLGLITPFYYMDFFDITEVPMLQQLSQEIAGCVRGRVGSNAQGMLWFETNPQLQPLADRAATHSIVMSTTFTDIRGEISFDAEEMEKQVTQVDFASEESDGDPIFSLAPAHPWSQGRWERIDGIRADSQNESNILSGLWEGYLNNQYANVPVNWRGNYRVFDVFPSEALNVNITAAQNKRGIVWTDQRCWTKRVMYEYRNTHLLVSSVIEKDAYGAPGITGEYPEDPPDIVVPPPVIIPPVIPPVPPDFPDGDETGDWRSRVYVATTTHGIYYSDDFTGPGGAMPTWTPVNGGLPSLAIRGFTADPFLPSNRQYCILNNTAMGGGGSTDIYHRVGGGNWSVLVAKDTLWNLVHAAPETCDGIVSIFTNVNQPGWLGAVCARNGRGLLFFWSTDYGATWTADGTDLLDDVNPNCFHAGAGLFKGTSAQAAGQVIYLAHVTVGAFTNSKLWVSTNGGTSFTEKNYFGVLDFESQCLQLDPCQDVIYFYPEMTRSTNQGTTRTSIKPVGFTGSAVGQEQTWGYRFQPVYIPSATPYASIIRAVDQDDDIWKTINSGVAWTETTHGALFNNGGIGILCYGDAAEKLYGFSAAVLSADTQHAIAVSIDEGATWEGKGGADRSAATVNGIPFDCGGVVGILPVYA